jgi:subtilisin family serine protease
MLVQVKPGRNSQPLHERHGNRVLKRFPDLNLEVVESCVPGEICDMLEKYRSAEKVESAEPDYIVQVEATPNDPAYLSGLLWALRNYGQGGGVAGADLDATAGWDGERLAGNVIVAVIDTGVRCTHEDLAPNIWTNSREIPGNGFDDDGNGYVDDVHGINAITGSGDPMDDNGHGTHVAGTIGAVGDNGRGSAGVAWRVQLLPLKFMDSTGQGAYSDAIECIEYARKAGAKIINASWGGPNYSSALRRAIDNARSAGIVFVTAAGNTGNDNDLAPFYPGSFGLDNVVAVAATTRCDVLASNYSNFGARSVQVAAPGSDIYSTWNSSDQAYISLSGTSMAAPHVAGILALMQVRFPTETCQQHIARLIGSSDPLPSLAGKCVSGGRVNLRRALAAPAVGNTLHPAKLSIVSGRSPASLHFRLTGQAGQSYAIDVSNGFSVWTPVLTNSIWSDGTSYFTDPSPRIYAQHFYRARLLPGRPDLSN